MKTADRYVVLIPHRDTGRILEEYRRKLFSTGAEGAFSFPAVMPLALVSHAFTRDELKACARALRVLSLQNGGKMSVTGSGEWGTGSGERFLGLLLDLPWDESVFAGNRKVLFRFPRPFLCAALLGDESPVPADLPQAPELSFRAAMAANLTVRPLGTGAAPYSLEWRISAPVWLPNMRTIKK